MCDGKSATESGVNLQNHGPISSNDRLKAYRAKQTWNCLDNFSAMSARTAFLTVIAFETSPPRISRRKCGTILRHRPASSTKTLTVNSGPRMNSWTIKSVRCFSRITSSETDPACETPIDDEPDAGLTNTGHFHEEGSAITSLIDAVLGTTIPASESARAVFALSCATTKLVALLIFRNTCCSTSVARFRAKG